MPCKEVAINRALMRWALMRPRLYKLLIGVLFKVGLDQCYPVAPT